MKRGLFLVFLIIFAKLSTIAQYSIIDQKYQNQIKSDVDIGTLLLSQGEYDSGYDYYIKAINTALDRKDDYICSFIVQSDHVFDTIISHYYRTGDTLKAHYYFEECLKALERWEWAGVQTEGQTASECWANLSNFYFNYALFAQSNEDDEYVKKCLIKSLDADNHICSKSDFHSNKLFLLSYYHLKDKEYFDAYKEAKESYYIDDSLNINSLQSLDYLIDIYSSWRSYSHMNNMHKEALLAVNCWKGFLLGFYENKGYETADLVLRQLNGIKDKEEEITNTIYSCTMLSTHICYFEELICAKKIEDAYNYTDTIHQHLIDVQKTQLWPLVAYNLILIMQTGFYIEQEMQLCDKVLNDKNFDTYEDNYRYDFLILAAQMYWKMGDVNKALDIVKNYLIDLPPTHKLFWSSRTTMGLIYYGMGFYEQYNKYAIEANDAVNINNISDTIFDVSNKLTTLSNLGHSYRLIKDYDNAEMVLLEAISLYDLYKSKVYLPIGVYFHLGQLYNEQKKYEKALECYAIVNDNTSESDVDKANVLGDMYSIYSVLGNHENGRKCLTDYWNYTFDNYKKAAAYLTENERYAYWQKNGFIIVDHMEQYAQYYGDIYMDIILNYKSILLETNKNLVNTLVSNHDTVMLAKYYSIYDIKDDILRNNTEKAFMTLYKNKYGNSDFNHIYSWKNIQHNLNKKDIAIEFFEYSDFNETRTIPTYGAFIITKNCKTPIFVKICTTEEALQIYNSSYKAYNGSEIFQLIWSNIMRYVKDNCNIYFSPCGYLSEINIESCLTPDNKLMSDIYKIYRLSHLSNIYNTSGCVYEQAALYGGLLYDMDTTYMKDDLIAANTNYTSNDAFLIDDSLSRKGWSYLHYSDVEIDEISSILRDNHISVEEYRGIRGSEESFKSLANKKYDIVHIATHGYYIADRFDYSALTNEWNYISVLSNKRFSQPITNSGLLLSGGADAWRKGIIKEKADDGILQSSEIAALNLSSVDLLVLSACQTAIGDYMWGGEVYGLQRSFKIAGVNTIIMTLWDVSDESTSCFMQAFYEQLLSGKTKREAFRLAQPAVRNKYPEPYYWAAFIMLD